MGIKRREKLRMACDGNGSRETSYRRGRSFEMNMIGKIHGIVWGPWTPVLFLMVGFVYSVRIRFFQIRKIPDWWNATIGNLLHDRSEHRGSFRSACTALAATIGTGNITGVAAAVIAGGPGAVFWMWVSAFLGMATAYGETVLGIRYREKGTGRRLDRGADDVSGKTAGMFMGGSSVRIVLHSGGIRDGQHGAGQRDRGDRILCVRDPGGGAWA